MTILQRISRSGRNVFLLCPRSLRVGGRRRGFNIAFFTIFFITCFLYITERKTESLEAHVDTIRLEKRANVLEQVTSTSTLEQIQTKRNEAKTRKSEVTRMMTAATEETIALKKQNVVTEKRKQIEISLKNCTKRSPELVGDMNSNQNITPTMERVIKHVGPDVRMGGCFSPSNCKALQKVAIIIPFKDRDAHLKTLLYYLHPMLMRQQLHYCIYVAEQFDNGQFNKATVMNAAFEEAVKLDNYDCIIFHDVDMIPENDKNFYMCGDQPRHLSPAIDKFQYKPHYGTDFGGVTGITAAQYRKANGHSNRFWGWGGEDNDMEYRIRYRNMSIIPASLKIGRYKMIQHLHPWKFSANKFPWKLNNTRKARANTDGLTDLRYRLVDTILHPMYTKLMIDIRRVEVTKLTLYIDGKSTMDVDLYPGECRYEEFPGKYLDFVIELTDKKEAQDLSLWPALDSKSSEPSLIKDNLIGPDGKKRRFSMLHDLEQAKDLCNKLAPECSGVERENTQDNFSLRRGGMPRHLVITAPSQPQPPNVPPDENNNERKSAEQRRYILPEKMAYLRYCPGEFSHFRPYKKPFLCSPEEKCPHTYSLEVQFSILTEPSEYLYYTDDKHFESHLEKGENHYTFTWPGGKAPNFSDPSIAKKYSFRTPDFVVPNIPGTYAVESKIVDRYKQPYFQWNWWFEVTSGDKQMDAKIRDTYWKTKMTKKVLKGQVQQQHQMMRQRAEKAKKNKEVYERKMQELKKHPRKPMPPHVQAMVDKIQNAYDKRENEGDPVAELVDPNAPSFQKDIGQIKVVGDDAPEPKPTSKTTTTTTKKIVRLPTLRSKFHIGPPIKAPAGGNEPAAA